MTDPFGNELEQAPSGGLSAFFEQPSVGGGPSISFVDKDPGTSYEGVVSRAITNGDIVQQTVYGTDQPAFFRDGSPKWVMKVPLTVEISERFPEGRAQWYVAGATRSALAAAMTAAGAPHGAPEAGAWVRITLEGRRPIKGRQPQNLIKVEYRRPGVESASDEKLAEAPKEELTAEEAALLAKLGVKR